MPDDSSQIHAPPETILFVEDEALIRMDMAEFLRECGYRVHEAANAEEAREALQSKFASGVGAALRVAQAAPSVELRRARLSILKTPPLSEPLRGCRCHGRQRMS